jgi:hypothetical protein
METSHICSTYFSYFSFEVLIYEDEHLLVIDYWHISCVFTYFLKDWKSSGKN